MSARKLASHYDVRLGTDPNSHRVPLALRHRLELVCAELLRARREWRNTGDRTNFASAYDEQVRLHALIRACPVVA